MEDSLVAMSFAQDLMYYFSKYEGVKWEAPTGIGNVQSEVPAYVHQIVAQAIHITFLENIQDIRECKQEMTDESIVSNQHDLVKLALEAVSSYFPSGYTPETFVGYCAMVMGVALLFFHQTDDKSYLEYTSGVVSIVLIGFVMNGNFKEEGGYTSMIPVCEYFIKSYKELKKLKNKKTKKKKNKKCKDVET